MTVGLFDFLGVKFKIYFKFKLRIKVNANLNKILITPWENKLLIYFAHGVIFFKLQVME